MGGRFRFRCGPRGGRGAGSGRAALGVSSGGEKWNLGVKKGHKGRFAPLPDAGPTPIRRLRAGSCGGVLWKRRPRGELSAPCGSVGVGRDNGGLLRRSGGLPGGGGGLTVHGGAQESGDEFPVGLRASMRSFQTL